VSADVAAGLLARSFQEWIKAHGPDTDGALPGEDGRFFVVHEGDLYEVNVTLREETPQGMPAVLWRECGILNCTDTRHLRVVGAAGGAQ
jgi:hypothetical protein